MFSISYLIQQQNPNSNEYLLLPPNEPSNKYKILLAYTCLYQAQYTQRNKLYNLKKKYKSNQLFRFYKKGTIFL